MKHTISQSLKNLAADHDISGMIPKAFGTLEVVAAATGKAREIAGHDEPDRHAYLEAVPAYLKSLPNSVELALSMVKIDAAAVLGIPGLASDHAQLSEAERKLSDAQAEVESAQILQGKRLARIHALEAVIEQAAREVEAWEIDWDGETAAAEKLIVDNWGKHPVSSPFDTLQKIAVLKRLAPAAVANIKASIELAEKELQHLRAVPPAPEPAKLVRGRQPLPDLATV